MPWKDATIMELRREFVTMAAQRTVSFTELCARFGISPKTGYKWLGRYAAWNRANGAGWDRSLARRA